MAKTKFQTERGEAKWRGILQDQRQSGQSIHKFCQKRRLGESTFYLWRRRLGQRAKASARSQSQPSTGQGSFVPVHVAAVPAGSGGQLDLFLPGGYRVRVTPPVDGPALAEVLTVLAQRSGEPEGQ